MRIYRVALLVLALAAIGCGSDDGGGAAEQPFGAFVSEQYADGRNWLCHPLAERDYCREDLSATVVYADGSTEIEEHVPAADPAIDCFYVYPTWSQDPGGNSDLEPADDEEGFIVRAQAARLNRVCRMFAPVYRQTTVISIFDRSIERDHELAQGDVVDAFKHYIANDNNGRGFVLVGHSQGAGRLGAMIRELVETDPFLRSRLVSAVLLGSTVEIPLDSDVGGDFEHIPACREPGQTGCVVSYMSYRATAPASEGDFFGQASEGHRALCTNPALLGGGGAVSRPYFSLEPSVLVRAEGELTGPFADPASSPAISTPFYVLPDFLELECVERDGFSFLEVTVLADPDDPRTDDIEGAIESVLPGWGLHIVDATIAMGDLVDLVGLQAERFVR